MTCCSAIVGSSQRWGKEELLVQLCYLSQQIVQARFFKNSERRDKMEHATRKWILPKQVSLSQTFLIWTLLKFCPSLFRKLAVHISLCVCVCVYIYRCIVINCVNPHLGLHSAQADSVSLWGFFLTFTGLRQESLSGWQNTPFSNKQSWKMEQNLQALDLKWGQLAEEFPI